MPNSSERRWDLQSWSKVGMQKADDQCLLTRRQQTSQIGATGGFAAAAGEVGATLGIFVLPQVKARGGVAAVLIMMALSVLWGRP
jgi:hypothetical protein